MTDPRNIARDKKVQQEKRHHGKESAPGADKTPQPGKKTHMENHVSDTPKIPDEAVPISTEDEPLSWVLLALGRDLYDRRNDRSRCTTGVGCRLLPVIQVN